MECNVGEKYKEGYVENKQKEGASQDMQSLGEISIRPAKGESMA